MTAFEYYQQHSSEICKQLHELGYTPKTIVRDASNENMTVWDYLAILFDFKL